MHAFFSLVALAATITVNALANALPINGLTQADIADKFQVYFTPAGYVFSIWGLIYLALLGFVAFHLLPSNRKNAALIKISGLFWISCFANMAWIFVWHHEYYALSLLAMLTILVSLFLINRDLASGEQQTGFFWFVDAPFRLYLAWITIATLANLTVVVDYYDLRPFDLSAQAWAVAMITLAGVIASVVGVLRRDLIFLCVTIWALVGIGVARDWTGGVALAATLVIGLVCGLSGFTVFRTAQGKTLG